MLNISGINHLVDNFDGIIIPGGFTYGDQVRAGAIAGP